MEFIRLIGCQPMSMTTVCIYKHMVSNSNACWHLACFAILIVYHTVGHQKSICSHAHSCLSHNVDRLTLHHMFCQCLHQFILYTHYDQVAKFLIYYMVHDVKYAQVMMSDSKKHQLLIECVLFTDFDLVKPSCLCICPFWCLFGNKMQITPVSNACQQVSTASEQSYYCKKIQQLSAPKTTHNIYLNFQLWVKYST